MRRIRFAMALASLMCMRLIAGPATTQSADQAVVNSLPVTNVSLDLDNVPAQKALAELTRQTNLEFAGDFAPDPNDPDRPISDAQPTVTMHVAQLPFLDAVLEMWRQTNVELNPVAINDRAWILRTCDPALYKHPPADLGQSFAFAPRSRNGPFVMIAQRLSQVSQRSYPVVDLAKASTDGVCRLDTMVLTDPSIWVYLSATSAIVDEATDDAGRSLMLGASRNFMVLPVSNPTMRAQMDVRLSPQTNRIAHFRCRLGFAVVTKTEKMAIDHLVFGQTQHGSVAGVECIVRMKDGGRKRAYEINVVANRRKLDEDHWRSIIRLLEAGRNGFTVSDAEGHRFILESTGAVYGKEDPERDVTMLFADPAAQTTGPPDHLTWEIPTQATEVWVPFEFHDLAAR